MAANPRRQRRNRWLTMTGTILASLVVAMLYWTALIYYANDERTHDLPNPIWGVFTRSYTYTPATAAALNPALLKTRPDLIFLCYAHDYIQLAGTYPCQIDVPGYAGPVDPILTQNMRTCPVKRQVTGIVITQVYVGIVGPDVGTPGARVTYVVSYADGTRWSGQEILGADQSQQYYLSHIHLTCWDSVGITVLYSYILLLSQVPSGMAYSGQTPMCVAYRCQP
jgi:hypothetical protein